MKKREFKLTKVKSRDEMRWEQHAKKFSPLLCNFYFFEHFFQLIFSQMKFKNWFSCINFMVVMRCSDHDIDQSRVELSIISATVVSSLSPTSASTPTLSILSACHFILYPLFTLYNCLYHYFFFILCLLYLSLSLPLTPDTWHRSCQSLSFFLSLPLLHSHFVCKPVNTFYPILS